MSNTDIDYQKIHDDVAIFLGGQPEENAYFATKKCLDWNHVMSVIDIIETETKSKYRFGVYWSLSTVIDAETSKTLVMVNKSSWPELTKIDIAWKAIYEFMMYYQKNYSKHLIKPEPQQVKKTDADLFTGLLDTKEIWVGENKTAPEPQIQNTPTINDYFDNFVDQETGVLFWFEGVLRSATITRRYLNMCYCEIDTHEESFEVRIPKTDIIGAVLGNSPLAQHVLGFKSKYVIFQPEHFGLKGKIN